MNEEVEKRHPFSFCLLISIPAGVLECGRIGRPGEQRGAGVKGAFRAVALVRPGPAARKWVFAPATLRTARAAMRRLMVTTSPPVISLTLPPNPYWLRRASSAKDWQLLANQIVAVEKAWGTDETAGPIATIRMRAA